VALRGPGLRQLFDRTYRLIARNRFRIAAQCAARRPAGSTSRGSRPARARRDLFLRLLGVIFLVAFLSLLPRRPSSSVARGCSRQLSTSPGCTASSRRRRSSGSTPATTRSRRRRGGRCSAAGSSSTSPADRTRGLLARVSLIRHDRQDFLSFQWDNLLLESAFFALFVTPAASIPGTPSAHPLAVFLMLWLLFRLHVESGAAKWLLGDPPGAISRRCDLLRDRSALDVGWLVRAPDAALGTQALQPLRLRRRARSPVPGVRAGAGARRRLRRHAGMQVSILLTGNYAFFNYLTIALSLFLLDDGQLGRLAAFIGWRWGAAPRTRVPTVPRSSPGRSPSSSALRDPVLPLVPPLRDLNASSPRPPSPQYLPIRERLPSLRPDDARAAGSRARGSADGVAWLPYEFRYKPGDPERPPAFVAPHQPRWTSSSGSCCSAARHASATSRTSSRGASRHQRSSHPLQPRSVPPPAAAAPARLLPLPLHGWSDTAAGGHLVGARTARALTAADGRDFGR